MNGMDILNYSFKSMALVSIVALGLFVQGVWSVILLI